MGVRPPLPDSSRPALSVLGATKRYGETVALAGVDIAVGTGSIVGLVGPNGSGKTTVLRSVAGLGSIDEGHILVGGAPAGSYGARASIALVPDEPAGFDELSGIELVALTHALWGAGPEAELRADVLATGFELGGRMEQRVGTLSRGLRRQVSAVAALSLGTPVVLVDEATATLDPEAVVVLREALRALAGRGAAVLLATQDIHFAGTACDDIVLLHRGEVLDRGTPAALQARHGADSLEDVLLAALGDRSLRARTRDAFRAL